MSKEISIKKGESLPISGGFNLQANTNSGTKEVKVPLQYLDGSESLRSTKPKSSRPNYINRYLSPGIAPQFRLSASEPIENKDIKVVLTWGSGDTDVDLHIQEEGGGEAWYGNLDGIEGATLDHDDINGFGPEVFTFANPRPGKYKVSLHYFSDHGNGPTSASVSVTVGNESKFQGGFGLSSGQRVEVYTIEISDHLEIKAIQSYTSPEDVFLPRCEPYRELGCQELPFTSKTGEDDFKVSTNLKSLDNGSIEYTVVNLLNGEKKVVSTTEISPLSIVFPHSNLSGKPETPIVLSFSAKIIGGDRDGEESKPKYVVQDVKDQLRQEYMDHRETYANSSKVQELVPVPSRQEILNNAQWISRLVATTNYFSAGEVFRAADSIYNDVYAYLMVDKAFSIINTARGEWGSPLKLGSTWRSPKYNAKVSNALASKHQTGDACDLQVPRNDLNFTEWKSQLNSLCQKAKAKLGVNYWVDVHGGDKDPNNLHCHINSLPGDR